MSSRLFQEVREKRGLAYSIYAFNYANSDSGSFGIYSATNPEKSNELIKVTLEELNKITNNISDEELDRAKSQLTAGILMSSESNNNRSQKIGSDILIHNRVRPYDEIVKKILDIDKKDVINLAQDIFSSNKTFSAIGKVKNINY